METKGDKKIIAAWVKEGFFILDSDGIPYWSPASIRLHPAHERDLVYYIPFGGLEKFKEVCKSCGYVPTKILSQFSLDENGLPFGD